MDKIFFKNILKIIFCSILTYIVIIISYMLIFFSEQLNLTGFGSKIMTLVFLIITAMVSFLAFLIILGVIKSSDLKINTLKNIFKEKGIG